MLKSKKIAITGGFASGKSTVCTLFQDLGCCYINTDAIVHEILKPQTDVGKKVIALLGHEIVENGHFNRGKIAKKVFKDQKILKALEKIIHPVVLNEIEKRTNEPTKDTSFFIIEIPLLYEIEKESFFDAVIVVATDEKICKQRMKEKGIDENEYEQRMAFQMSPSEKQKKADYIIENNGSMTDLKESVKQLYQTFLAQC